MLSRSHTLALSLLALAASAMPAAAELNGGRAFSDMVGTCARDEKTLWGYELCAPMLIVDPATRAVDANQPDREGKLALVSTNVWGGALPETVAIADGEVDWAGVRWLMIVAPLPEAGNARRVMLAHRSFERLRPKLNIAPSSAVNAHLETEAGRTWMRLEMRALAAALRASDDATRVAAARDALAFRAARLAAFPGAETEERAHDRDEGLAEYTGVRLAVGGALEYAASVLDRAEAGDDFAKNYARATGPAWGLLLDKDAGYWREARWRRTLGQRSPAEALANRVRLDRVDIETRKARYNGAAIAAEEATRSAAKAS